MCVYVVYVLTISLQGITSCVNKWKDSTSKELAHLSADKNGKVRKLGTSIIGVMDLFSLEKLPQRITSRRKTGFTILLADSFTINTL